MPLRELLSPFAVFTSFISNINSLHKKLMQTEKELAVYREVVPPNRQLADQNKEIEALKSHIGQLEDKLRTVVGNERALAAEAADLRKQVSHYEDEIMVHQQDAKELSELREVIYKLMTEQDAPDTEEDKNVSYPYIELPDGIICFGGYDQWHHRMQERFPTVRFIPVSNRYDPSILRRAPCVWIQSCFISHVMYYRIVNDARAARIDTHYFNSHSVESSSKLLIETMSGGNQK